MKRCNYSGIQLPSGIKRQWIADQLTEADTAVITAWPSTDLFYTLTQPALTAPRMWTNWGTTGHKTVVFNETGVMKLLSNGNYLDVTAGADCTILCIGSWIQNSGDSYDFIYQISDASVASVHAMYYENISPVGLTGSFDGLGSTGSFLIPLNDPVISVARYQSNTTTLWKNKVQYSSDGGGSALTASKTLHFGCGTDENPLSSWRGTISRWILWDRALTNTEVDAAVTIFGASYNIAV